MKPGFHKVCQLFLIKQCKINVAPSESAKHSVFFFLPYKPYERKLETHFHAYISILLNLRLEKRKTNFWLLKNPLGVSMMRTLS